MVCLVPELLPSTAFLEGSVLMECGLQEAPSPCPPAGCLCVGTGCTEPTGLRSSWQSVYGRETAVKGPALPVRRRQAAVFAEPVPGISWVLYS